jgi:hypothetical protein
MPIADVATTPPGTPVTIAVLANDSGWTGTLDPTSVLVVSAPAHGTTAVAPAGTVTYTPAPGFIGVDSFVYRVCDTGGGGCATAPVTVRVTAPVTPPVPPDPPPVAVPDTATVVKGTTATIGVLSNDSDPDGDLDPASLTIVTPPTSGTITVNPDHTVSYTSAANAGADSFIYKVCDQNGPCATAAVTVTVVNNSQGPKTVPTFATTLFGQPVKIDVLANVTPGSSPIVPASLAIDTAPAHGTAVVNADHTITYTPVPGFVGIDNFKYAVKDSLNASSTGNVQVVSA